MKVAKSKHCVIYKDMEIIIILLVKSNPNNTGGPQTRNCMQSSFVVVLSR